MNLVQAMIWFSGTAATIFAPFAIVEKFSSKKDLENYYLLITVKRFKFSAQWYLLLIKFVDLLFGFHTVYGRLIVPSVSRVAVYTCCCTTGIILLVSGNLVKDWYYITLITFAFIFNFLFDYVNFTKTRAVLEFVRKHLGIVSIVFGIFLEFILIILLSLCSFYISIGMWEILSMAFPSLNKGGFMGVEINLDVFFIVLLLNVIAASFSTIIVTVFVIATIASYVANNISVIQQFLDTHTAVLDKPIQILGAMVVVLFAVLFWTWFGFHQLAGQPLD